jgi:hypothetical protein
MLALGRSACALARQPGQGLRDMALSEIQEAEVNRRLIAFCAARVPLAVLEALSNVLLGRDGFAGRVTPFRYVTESRASYGSEVDSAARTAVDGRAADDPCSGEQGRDLWARGCRTSIAHPTFNPSPSQLGHPVRAWTRRPCES